ncbi:rhs repeat-associated core domain-containing protein : : PT-HINT: Toxin_43 [Gemmataceae bacterium]|nr:rhs repeat-associated core domain-containing protein : : PT-HINT: Toxin_43 [Gemmataceae bacterium]VTU02537.1 rhs repeat-associated core domain-containing protein : : PT-HINT: Toxin_43 [Gemmataceae bacterium]
MAGWMFRLPRAPEVRPARSRRPGERAARRGISSPAPARAPSSCPRRTSLRPPAARPRPPRSPGSPRRRRDDLARRAAWWAFRAPRGGRGPPEGGGSPAGAPRPDPIDPTADVLFLPWYQPDSPLWDAAPGAGGTGGGGWDPAPAAFAAAPVLSVGDTSSGFTSTLAGSGVVPRLAADPVASTDFGTDGFELQSGAVVRADGTFELADGGAPGSWSGGDTVTGGGTDAFGVSYTVSTTYTFTYSITSTESPTGEWTYAEEYAYTFDSVTTPATDRGAATHSWGSAGYTFEAEGSATHSSFTLTVDRDQHRAVTRTADVGASGAAGWVTWTSADDEAWTRTVTGHTDLVTGAVTGTDAGTRTFEGAYTGAGSSTHLIGRGRTGTATNTLTAGGEESRTETYAAGYDGAVGLGGAWAGVWVANGAGSDWQSYAGGGTYTYTSDGDGTAAFAGILVESGRDDSAYASHAESELSAGGTWGPTAGTRTGTMGGFGTASYADAGSYASLAAVGSVTGVAVAGVGSGTETEFHTYAAATSATFDPITGTWTSAGTLDTTATGTSTATHAGSGAYDYLWSEDGTFGPDSLAAVGKADYHRAGTVTASGTSTSDYEVTQRSTLDATGEWAAVSGSGTATASGSDTQALAGTVAYSHPILNGTAEGATATVSGVTTEAEAAVVSFALGTTSSLDPMAGTWASTGTLDTTATGTSTATHAGSGAYDYLWSEEGTFGPDSLAVAGEIDYHRAGAVTETGSSTSDYVVTQRSTLDATGEWAAVSGSGTATASGSDTQALAGTVAYSHPIANGEPGGATTTVSGVTTEAEAGVVSFAMGSASTLAAAGTWTSAGTLDMTATGSSSATSTGSGAYDYAWSEAGTFGPDSLQAVGYQNNRRYGTVTESGMSTSDYEVAQRSTLDATGEWAAVSGTGTASASGSDTQALAGTWEFSHPVKGGGVAGATTESEAAIVSFALGTSSTLDAVAGTWSSTGTLDTTATGTSTATHAGSGAYDYGWWGEAATYGPDSLQAVGNQLNRRYGTVTESGGSTSDYEVAQRSTLDATGEWAAVSGTGTASASGSDTQALAGTWEFSHPVKGGGVAGATTESEAAVASFALGTASTLDAVAGTWSSAGTLDTTATGTSTATSTGSGAYDYSWWSDEATFGPDSLRAVGYQTNHRVGMVTETGTSTSDYEVTQRSTLDATGEWAAVSGSGTATASGGSTQSLAGTVSYNHPVRNTSVSGVTTESEAAIVSFALGTSSTLDAVAGTWSSTGTLDTTATGTSTATHAGSGAYDYGWWGEAATYGPDSLQAVGNQLNRRYGTVTESGGSTSDYEVAQRSTLDATGEWAAVSGTGTASASGSDTQALAGTWEFSHPVKGGGVAGATTESEAAIVSFALGTSSTLDAVAGTWSSTGTLDTTATGTSTATHAGSGAYDYGWWGEAATYGPDSLQAVGNQLNRRYGTVTESGGSTSDYEVAQRSTLDATGEWAAVSGTGTASASGSDTQALAGTWEFSHPVKGGGVAGATTEAEAAIVSFALGTSSTLDAVAGTWSSTGTLDTTATGTSTATHAGSGAYDYGWWGEAATYGPDSLQAVGNQLNRRYGTVTESGGSTSDYEVAQRSTLDATGEWAAVSGTGTASASGSDTQALAGTWEFSHPVKGGGVAGATTEAEAAAAAFVLQTAATLDAGAGTWTRTGTLNTTATGESTYTSSATGAYDDGHWGDATGYAPESFPAENEGFGYIRRIGTATESGSGTEEYEVTALNTLGADGTWDRVSSSGTATSLATEVRGLDGTAAYNYSTALGTVTGTATEVETDTTTISLEYAAGLNATTGEVEADVAQWVDATRVHAFEGSGQYTGTVNEEPVTGTFTNAAEHTATGLAEVTAVQGAEGTWGPATGTFDTTASGWATDTFSASVSYTHAGGEAGTYGPARIAASGDQYFTRTGTVSEQGGTSTDYQFSQLSTLALDGNWTDVSGTGTASQTGSEYHDLAETVAFTHPVDGGTASGTATVAVEYTHTYELETGSTLNVTDGTWTTTGTLRSTTTGADSQTYAASGTYTRPRFGVVSSGSLSESGDGHSTHAFVGTWSLQAGGGLDPITGTGTASGEVSEVLSYSDSGTGSADGSDYLSGIGNPAGTGSASGSGVENWTSQYDVEYGLEPDDTWKATSGTSSAVGTATWEADYSVSGPVSNGTWSVGIHDDGEFHSLTTGVIGADGKWVLTSTSGVSDTVTGFTHVGWNSSTTATSGGGTVTTSVAFEMTFPWVYTYESDIVLAADGTITTDEAWAVAGNGGGAGTSLTTTSSSSSSGSNSTTSHETAEVSWQVSIVHATSGERHLVSTVGPDGARTQTGTAAEAGSHTGTAQYGMSVNGTSSGVAPTENGTSNWWAESSGSDQFTDTASWSEIYNADGTVDRSASQSNHTSGSQNGTSGSSWVRNWLGIDGEWHTDSGSTTGNPTSSSYSNPDATGGFEAGWYTRAVAGDVALPYSPVTGDGQGLILIDGDSNEVGQALQNELDTMESEVRLKGGAGVNEWGVKTVAQDHGIGLKATAEFSEADRRKLAELDSRNGQHLTPEQRALLKAARGGGSVIIRVKDGKLEVREYKLNAVERYLYRQNANYRGYISSGMSQWNSFVNTAVDTNPITGSILSGGELVTGTSLRGHNLGARLTDEEMLYNKIDVAFALLPGVAPAIRFGVHTVLPIFPILNRLHDPAAAFFKLLGIDACFAAGTPIRTPEGSRPIEEFKPGDMVLSRDENDPSGPVVPKMVEEVFVRESLVWHLHVGGHVIRTTAEHPFYVEDKGWTACYEIQVGSRLLCENGESVVVDEVVDTSAWEVVYNLRIADYHTYFVGEADWPIVVWSHNRNGCPGAVGSAREYFAGFAKRYLSKDQAPVAVKAVLTYVRRIRPGSPPIDRAELTRQIGRQVEAMNNIIKAEGLAGLKKRIRSYTPAVEKAGRAYVRTLTKAGKGKAHLHEPDMRAGGLPADVFGVGSKRVNSVLGGQANKIAQAILKMKKDVTVIEYVIRFVK